MASRDPLPDPQLVDEEAGKLRLSFESRPSPSLSRSQSDIGSR